MNSLREALADYLVLRRSLGFKLHETALGLKHFILFLEQKGFDFITSNLALEWAILPARAQPSHWSRRLTWVRGFAKYRSAFDSRTETPLQSLLPFRTKRVVPYLYSDEEIQALMKESLTIGALGGFRGRIFYTQIEQQFRRKSNSRVLPHLVSKPLQLCCLSSCLSRKC
jgi:integrase/recombinase XerD